MRIHGYCTNSRRALVYCLHGGVGRAQFRMQSAPGLNWTPVDGRCPVAPGFGGSSRSSPRREGLRFIDGKVDVMMSSICRAGAACSDQRPALLGAAGRRYMRRWVTDEHGEQFGKGATGMLHEKWIDEMLAFSAGLGGRGRGISWLPGREALAVAVEPRRHLGLLQPGVGCPQVDRARASGAARAALSSPRPHTVGARSIGCRSSSPRCRGWPALARGLRIRAGGGWLGQQAHGFRYGRTVDDLGGVGRAVARPAAALLDLLDPPPGTASTRLGIATPTCIRASARVRGPRKGPRRASRWWPHRCRPSPAVRYAAWR